VSLPSDEPGNSLDPTATASLQATLRSLAEVPVSEHPALFEAIHAELETSLAKLDEL